MFGTVKLTKNADPDKYEYSGYGIGFDAHLQFSWSDGSSGFKNVVIFWCWNEFICCMLIIKIETY